MLDRIKPAAVSTLRPLTRALIRSRIHPNTLTFVGLAISAGAAWLYADGPLVWAGILVLLAGVFDLLDGAVARESGRVSRYGAFLDSSVDRYAEIIVFLGILLRFGGDSVAQIAVLLAVAGSLMVSYTRARAEGLGQELHGGLLQRPERVVLLALGSFFGEAGLRAVVVILAIFTNVTSVQRMILVAGAMRSPRPDVRSSTSSVASSGNRPASGAKNLESARGKL
jgi:CDP-diacylglycerol--glycerol-3-phosphate 3-phosphatidyltransferase